MEVQYEYNSVQVMVEKLKNSQGIFSAVLYGVCSTSMVFANKTILTVSDFNFPFFIMTSQMVLCIAFLELLRKLGKVNFPKYTIKAGKSFAWPSLFYALHSTTALLALLGLSIPMYTAIKRCTPIITLFLSVILFKKKVPSVQVVLSVFLISFGCIIASLGDFHFDITAYIFGGFSILLQGLYLTLSQQSLEDLSPLHVLYLNSYNTLPFYIFLFLIVERLHFIEFPGFLEIGFITGFIIQTTLGVLLNYSIFLCTAENSALTTSLVGVLKSVLQTVIGFFTFGGVDMNTLNVFGICLNTLGGVLYSYSKYLQSYKAPSKIVKQMNTC